ncbi:glycosyltransferase family 4 protein [Thermus igniterrae]|uniref:glycosyltransferase family 4 protein n=1 Tax=Thermus igniterrae TaxID=88189 RepID=UPI00059307DB|nr:glycosyltransferase family 4 protein [Thermus igniterrae]
MRAFWILEASGGGTGRHVLDLALGLAERGVEVHLAYSPLRMDAIFAQGLPLLESRGVRTWPIPLRRSPHPSDLGALFRLLAYARREGPFHLVHGHSSKGGALARLLGRLLGIPAVYTPHGVVTLSPFLSPWERAIYGGAERLLAPLTALALAVSPWEGEALRTLGYRRVAVVENGIALPPLTPEERASARTALGITGDTVAMGFVGRLDQQKDPLLALRAFAQLGLPQTRLLLVGSGPLDPACREEVRALGLEGKVAFLGEREAREVLPALDLLLFTSAYEGLPYVLLEALALEVPVVAAPLPGLGDWLQEKGLAQVAPSREPAALAKAMAGLLENPALADALRQRGRAWVEGQGLEGMVEKILALYQELVHPTKAGKSPWA